MSRKLTPMQMRFAEFCAQCSNAKKAAKLAGYASKNAMQQGKKLVDNSRVQAYLSEITKAETKTRIASAEDRQAFWTKVMYDDGEQMKDRLRAAELLGKSQADFVQKVDHRSMDRSMSPRGALDVSKLSDSALQEIVNLLDENDDCG
ncbi:MAG: terminase small subunit [Thiotrichales bacterium]